MAIVRAVKSGVWSDPTVWAPSPPTSADDVYSNTFTVTIDVSPTVLSISNAATTGVTAGGSFVPTNGITLTCTGAGVVGASSTMITSTLVAGQSFSIVGSVSQIASGTCINNNGNGGINIIGAVNHTSNSNVSYTIVNSTLGSITIIGNVTSSGNYFSSNNAVRNIGNGVVSITGDVRNANAQDTCNNAGAGTMSITGNVFGGSSGQGTSVINSGIMSIIGSLTGGSTNAAVSNGGTLTHSGTATASNNNPALVSSSASAVNILSGPFLVSANGTHAVYALRWFWQNTIPPTTYYQVRSANLAVIRPLYTADSVGGNPAVGNVRSGTVYGPNNELTGTCAVPGAASVLAGVPIDATVGTVTITAADIRSAVGLSSANLDTQFSNIPANVRTNLSTELARIDTTVSSRLASASYQAPLDAAGTRTAIGLATANLDSQLDTLPTAVENASAVRTELTPELSRIDTTVSSRLASSSYAIPPTATQNASAVRTELAPELARIDVATSTRSTFDSATDTVANVTLVATTTNLTNPPDVPTTSEIADAVRVELTPELNHLDADVSSRLASADYTTPPTALENAEAVETQLSIPLGNLDVAISTRSTFDPLSDTVAQVTLVDTTTNLTNPPDVPTTSEIAEAVRVELTPELDRIDTTVSSRSTFNPATDTVAQVALVDTTTNLTNPPDVPTTTEIADAVRTELTPELNRIDTDVSSRLATADYEQAPTSEQNAEAVRVELTPELDRIANCATVATTGEQIQDAWARSPNIP